MNNSTQITTFIVLIASLVGGMLLINRQDIDSEVNTMAESRLPQVYVADNDSVQGFSFRYPRGWAVEETGGGKLRLSQADHQFELAFSAEEQALTPAQALGPSDSAENLSFGSLPAAQEITRTGEAVNYRAVILLAENTYLKVNSAQSIAAADWEGLSTELTRSLNSIQLSEDFRLVAPIFTYTLPANWATEAGTPLAVLSAFSPAVRSAETPTQAELQMLVLPKEQTAAALRNLLNLQQNPDLAAITDPLELIQTLPQVSTDYTPTEASYLGLEGFEMPLGGLPDRSANLIVLDPKDGYTIIALQLTLSSADTEALAADHAALIESIQYTSPDPAIFE